MYSNLNKFPCLKYTHIKREIIIHHHHHHSVPLWETNIMQSTKIEKKVESKIKAVGKIRNLTKCNVAYINTLYDICPYFSILVYHVCFHQLLIYTILSLKNIVTPSSYTFLNLHPHHNPSIFSFRYLFCNLILTIICLAFHETLKTWFCH